MKTLRFSTALRAVRPVSAALGLSFALAAPLSAADFRVETKVYVGDGEEPVSETLTIFQNGRVYDLPAGDDAIWTVMETPEKRFVILSAETRKKAVVSFDELRDLIEKMQAIGLEGDHAAIYRPALVSSTESETKRLILQNEAMKYRVKALQPTDAAVAAQYESFGNWFARLNARYSRNFPPFGRLELNAALAERGIVPTEIEWTLLPRGNVLQTTVLRSTHDYQWTLSTRDEEKVKQAQSHLVNFQDTEFRALFPSAVAGTDPAAKR